NKHAFILIAVENARQAQLAIKKRVYIAGNWLIAEKCKENIAQKQYQNCQKYDHSTKACFGQSICQLCAEKHKTFEHKCSICNTQGQNCPHTIVKCSNCLKERKQQKQQKKQQEKELEKQKYREKRLIIQVDKK